MARVLIELDPEYVPWDVPQERPRMQRRRRRRRRSGGERASSSGSFPKWLLAVPLLILVACGALAWTFGPRDADQPALSPSVVGSPPGADAAELGEGKPPNSDSDYVYWCEFGGLLMAPGVHYIGDEERICERGEWQE